MQVEELWTIDDGIFESLRLVALSHTFLISIILINENSKYLYIDHKIKWITCILQEVGEDVAVGEGYGY